MKLFESKANLNMSILLTGQICTLWTGYGSHVQNQIRQHLRISKWT
jgi:hypothetical protein